MDLKNFKPVCQDQDSYTVMHPNGRKLFIEKAKLNEAGHKKILHLFQGAQVDNPEAVDPQQQISNLGGGDPTASFTAPSQVQPEPTAPAEEEQTDASSGGDFTRVSPQLISDKDQAAIDAIKAKEGPVSGDADYVPKAAGREPDSVSSDPLVSEKTSMQGLLGEQVKQQEEALAAGQSTGKDIADIQQGGANALANLPSYNDIVAGYQAKDQKLMQDYADAKIDPQQLLHNMGTGSKILTGIGMVLSGMGSATTGQPNYAMSVLNDAIKRDVEAQSENRSAKSTLWQMNRQAMGNDTAANLATENQIKAGVLQKLQAAQTRAILPQEKLRAQTAIDQLKGEMLQNNLRRGLLTQPASGTQGEGELSGADPATLVPEMVKDPAQQKQVYDEIKGRQNIARNGQKMLDIFDQASKDTSGVVGRPASLAYEPGSVIKLKQLMLPNFDKIDSTVRQATMDASYHDILPSALDTDDRKLQKKQALKDWMNSNMSAPVSKGNYIDLDRFQSTAAPNFAQPSPAAAQPQTIERKAKDGRIIVYDANTKKPLGVKK